MAALTYLHRVKGRYFWRARVPLDLFHTIGRPELHRPLGTADPGQAKRRVVRRTLLAGHLFDLIRQSPDLPQGRAADLVQGFPSGGARVGRWRPLRGRPWDSRSQFRRSFYCHHAKTRRAAALGQNSGRMDGQVPAAPVPCIRKRAGALGRPDVTRLSDALLLAACSDWATVSPSYSAGSDEKG